MLRKQGTDFCLAHSQARSQGKNLKMKTWGWGLKDREGNATPYVLSLTHSHKCTYVDSHVHKNKIYISLRYFQAGTRVFPIHSHMSLGNTTGPQTSKCHLSLLNSPGSQGPGRSLTVNSLVRLGSHLRGGG